MTSICNDALRHRSLYYIKIIGRDPLGHLHIENLVTRTLEPLNLTVAAGESVSLCGPSGCGKSLLLRAIADLDPHDGEVLLDEKACHTYRASEWRKRVGFLPAVSQWWRDSVGEHFSGDFDRQLLSTWFAALGFDESTLELPVATLSSGERQRLALLRLLVNQPQALLLDEPSAALDPENTRRVEALVADYRARSHCAAIWVSHDPKQRQRVASRHFVIKQGRLQQVEGEWN